MRTGTTHRSDAAFSHELRDGTITKITVMQLGVRDPWTSKSRMSSWSQCTNFRCTTGVDQRHPP
jgi:hypothetical protein